LLTPPIEIMVVLGCFAQVFSERTWDWVQVLVVGAILAPRKRTVTSVLTAVGLSQEKQYQRYHRVLNRAKWSSLQASKILLGLLVAAFVATGGTVVLGADETLERRQGKQIKMKGVFRDAVRSSKKYTVKACGLRWVSMMLLVNVPWSTRVWALPFLTVLAPSEKTNIANGKRHKTSIDWVIQLLCQARRWLRPHKLVLVVDGGLMAFKLGQRCRNFANPVTLVSRLRLDAQLYAWPEQQPKGKRGPKPQKGPRQPSLKQRREDPKTVWRMISIRWYGGRVRTLEITSGQSLWYTPGEKPLPIRWVLVHDPVGKRDDAAFLCTELAVAPEQILHWYGLRWNVEVTFEDVRAHLGLETQRQWSDLAIARTTPALLALYSVVVLLAQHLLQVEPLPVRRTAWYSKPEATFADVIALVRRSLWQHTEFVHSPILGRHVPIPDNVLHGLVDLLCYAA
jgi:DDE superfamily endonuclease